MTPSTIIVNPKFLPHWHTRARYLVLYGGSGSGKSVFVSQKVLLRCLEEPGHRFLCVRKVAATVKNSIFALFSDLLSQYGLTDKVKANKSDHSFTFPNGSMILTSGLDDVEKLKSIAGISSVWVEEATELEQADFDQLDLRLRGQTVSYKQICVTFNPIDESHWLKGRFFDQPDKEVVTVHSTYRDNAFIDADYKRLLEQRVRHDENLYRIYVRGEWGRLRTGQEFYSSFKRSRHVTKVPYLPHVREVLLSFDFNVLPYMTLLCAQLVYTPQRIAQVRVFKEYCLPSPRNSIEGVCKAFGHDFGALRPTVSYFGDASGNNRIPGYSDLKAFYEVEAHLKPYLHNQSDQVLRRNPGVMRRRDFINRILAGGYPIELLVDESCTELIADLDGTLLAVDGKLKEMHHDKATGQRWQKRGHTGDALDYLLVSTFKSTYEEHLKTPFSQFIHGRL